MAFSKPQEVLAALAHAYYDERDIEKVLSCVTDDAEWIGTEANDSAKGKAALRKLLEAYFAALPGVCSAKLDEPKVHNIGKDVAILTVTGRQLPGPGARDGAPIRATLCCVKTEQGWLVADGHTSVPNAAQEKQRLQNALEHERKKQKSLLDSVPGGVAIYRIKKDGRIYVDYISDGLARICGYENSADALKVMGADAHRQVLAEDYPMVEAACRKAITKGEPASAQYRLNGKDETPVYVTLNAALMQDAQLDEDDRAVLYTVQMLVSKEYTQKAEKQKLLNSLLNTVPAGLGIFEINEDGISQDYMNDAFYNLIGTKREERTQYVGPNALDTAHPKDVIKLRQAIRQMQDGENLAQLDYRVMGGDKSWVWLHMTASVVERKDDNLLVYVAFYECTQRKRQQLQLLQNQKAVQLAEEQGRISVWSYNIDKGIILQQAIMDKAGHMGYPSYIANVPQCFVEGGSVHPDDVDKFLEVYKRLEDGQEKTDELYRLKDLNTGTYNWLRMYYQRVENNDEGERMAVGFSIEVNKQQEAVDRYQTEQKLREQMYADAVIYMEYNLTESVYVGKNNLSEKYRYGRWECPTMEQYRENMSKNVAPPYLENVVQKMYAGHLLQAFERGENKVACEYRSLERTEKTSWWYRITAAMVKRPDTGDVMAFVYVEDIEKEKNRQLAVESSMTDGIEFVAIIRVADGNTSVVQAHNAGMTKKLGESFVYDDEFVKRSHTAVIAASDDYGEKAALLSTVLQVLKKQEVYQYSVTIKRKNERAKRQLFRFRYLDDRKTNIVLFVSDITAVYQEEQHKKLMLENALSEAQKASKAKAEFYSRMSHDMRTPMNGILGMAELSKGEEDPAKLKENITKIEDSGKYLLSLINDTLDIQRIESGKMKLEPAIVSTTDVVNNILDMVRVTAKAKGVHLKYSKGNADLDWYVRVDALRLKQIFINLLSNAIKFTPKGGTVELEFELLEREGMISHDVVYVRDTGVGMSKAFLERGIFKPFSQESNAVSATYAGSGLGLSIAKSLVELMGGRIEVESRQGIGTTFAVYLDFERVSDEEAKAALRTEKKQTKAASAQLKGRRILLVEDHPLNAEIATRLLEKQGCIVTWEDNGKKAVQAFAQAAAGSFDAILMDIRMPVMDGLEATREIRALDKADAAAVPIIAMTANAYEEDVERSREAGMNAHLSKPISPAALYEEIARALQ